MTELEEAIQVLAAPVVHVTTYRSLLGERRPIRRHVPWTGQTFLELVTEAMRSDWPVGTELAVHCNAREIGPQQREEMVPPEAWVTVAPRVGILAAGALTFWEGLGLVILGQLVGMAVGYVAQRLVGTKNTGADRGDERSPAQTWDGIKTSRGPGMRKPVVYGETDVGGHVISSKLYELNGVEYVEELVLLSSGRIDSVGGIDGGEFGEADDLGRLDDPFNTTPNAIPDKLRINGVQLTVDDCNVALRMGEIRQNPVQGFVQASTIEDVGQELKDKDARADYIIVDPDSTRFAVRLSFPGGLYEIDNGNYVPYIVGFDIQWKTATTNWTAPFRFDVGGTVHTSAFVAITPYFSFDGVKGPFTVRITRVTAANSPGKQASTACTWTKVIHDKEHEFAYPGSAYMAIRFRANERLQGGSAEYLVRMRGKRVKVWDESLSGGGLSPNRYWATPSGSDTYAGIWTYPAGNNPAWVLLDLLLDREGLGKQIDVSQIDLQSFRDWADYCDESVPGPSAAEARHRVDGVLDKGESAADVIQQILTCGRAALTTVGNRISVVYWYRDAHGRGTNSVPARGTIQHLFATSSLQDFRITWRDPSQRPNVLDVAIMNAALDYAHDVIPVPDPVLRQTPATLAPRGAHRDSITMLLCTRESQAKREAYWLHAQNRLGKTEVEFTAGVDALPVTVGDVIGVQFDGVQFYDTNSYGYRTGAASSASATLVLDHAITASGWSAQVLQTDGTVATVTITNGTYAAGASIPVSAAITCKKGAPVALGVTGKITRSYQVSSIGTAREMRRQVKAFEWQPAAYDEVGEEDLEDSSPTASGDDALLPAGLVESPVLRRNIDGNVTLGFRNPDGFGSAKTRIYRRSSETMPWEVLDEVIGQRVDLKSLPPGKPVSLALAVQERNGAFQQPTQATIVTLTPPEFPVVDVPDVFNLVASVHGDGVLLTWSYTDDRTFAYYEVRRGTYWLGSQLVARTHDTHFFVRDPGYGSQRYMVRARHRGGPYSGKVASVTPNFPGPTGLTVSTTQTDLDPSLLGSGDSGISYDSTNKRVGLAAGKFRGIYSGLQINLGSVQTAWWGPRWDTWERQAFTEAEVAALDESEQRWWTELGREASLAFPGADFDAAENVAGLELESDSRRTGTGSPVGFIGTHTRVKAEMRFDTSGAGAWTAWGPMRAQLFTAQKFETRFVLDRRLLTTEVYLAAFATGVLV